MEVGGREFTVVSSFASEDLWRVEVLGDGDPVDVRIDGGLGSDGSTRYYPQEANFAGFSLPYLVSNDGDLDQAGSDPQLLYLLAPRWSAEADGIEFTTVDGNDSPVIAGTGLSPGFAFYLAIGDVPHLETIAAIAPDLLVDVQDRPLAGDYELTVQWAPLE